MPVRTDSRACHCLAVALLAYLGSPAVNAAQSSPPTSTSNASVGTGTITHELDRVTVTGSRIARAQAEGPVAVTVITAEEVQQQGFSTIKDALTTLTQNTGDTNNETDQTGSTADGQFLNLRGMGPGYTLVLLNGKRMADYPQAYGGTSQAVSLGTLPAAAIERIEVLSSGASAIYGSDAVAGVVNIITKTHYSGDGIRLRGGTTTQGGGDTGLLQWSGGKSADRWSLTYAFEKLNREAIMGSQRENQDSLYDNPRYRNDAANATAQSAVQLVDANGGYLWPDASGQLSTATDVLVAACAATDSSFAPYKSSRSASAVNRCGSYDYGSWASIQNGYNKTSGYLYATFDFSADTQGYAQALLNRSKNTSYNRNQYYWSSSTEVYDPQLGLVSASRIVSPEQIGGLVRTSYDERSSNLAMGVRGRMLEHMDWDAGFTYSRDDITVKRRRFLKQNARDYFLGQLQGYTDDGYEIRNIDIDHLFGPVSRSDYDSITTVISNDGSSENAQGQFSLTGNLFELPAGPIAMAFVAEVGRQEYTLDPDQRTLPDYTGSDAIYNYTATPAGGSRKHYAMGLEFSVPILRSLTAHLAGRYDAYDDSSDVGGALTWETALEYRPLRNLLLRATRATTFRAPDLTYLYSGKSSNYAYIVDAYLCRKAGIDPKSADCTGGDNYYQVFQTYQGNIDLAEETGRSDTLGAVWDLAGNMSLSLDYYRIELYGEVAQIDSTYLMDQYANCMLGVSSSGVAVDGGSPACQFYKSLVTRDQDERVSTFSSYPINQAMTRTQGLDASWKYRLDAGRWGAFGFKLGYTKVQQKQSRLYPGDALVDELATSSGYYGFRSRANWQLGWQRGDWAVSLYGYRWGSLPNYAGTARLAPYVVWNANVSTRITPKARLALSVANLLDKMPSEDSTHVAYPYYNHSYSAIGRQINADLTYEF